MGVLSHVRRMFSTCAPERGFELPSHFSRLLVGLLRGGGGHVTLLLPLLPPTLTNTQIFGAI